MEKLKPPANESLFEAVNVKWNYVLKSWERGWNADQTLADIEGLIEYRRELIFDRKTMPNQYDWEGDWFLASDTHKFNLELVQNRNIYNKEAKAFWQEISRDAGKYGNEVSLESLRAMIIINGATIIACITLLSGQVQNPTESALTVAKVALIGAVVSLIMMATGHVIQHTRVTDFYVGLSGRLVGNVKHKRLWALHRYVRRYTQKWTKIANALMYGSIFVFAFVAFLSALILAFSGN